jgi:membrane protease YdiL (CAAX protease family)
MIPLTIVATRQHLTREQLGLSFKNIVFYLPISILVGLVLGLGESLLIKTTSLIPDLSLINVLELVVVMIFFVGVTEELLFRSIIQTRLEEVFGPWTGLIFSSLVFGFMNSGYGVPYVIFYAFFEGLLIGRIFQKTRSLPFIALIHGFTSVFSFGIIPLMGHAFGFL